MFNACEVFRELRFPEDKFSYMIPAWGEAMSCMPDPIDFLMPDAVKSNCEWSSFDERTTRMMLETAEITRNTPALRAFAWHVFYKLTKRHYAYGNSSTSFHGWPFPEYHLKDHAALFYVVPMIGMVPEAVRTFRNMGVSDSIICDTLRWSNGVKVYEQVWGRPGIDPMVIYWQRHYAAGRIITLGRFQYKMAEVFSFGAMLKNRNDGSKLLVAEPGLRINTTGYVVQSGLEADTDFITTFENDGSMITGYAVDPRGFILPGKRCFSLSQWEIILQQGDPLLDMHIPAGGGMTPERAADSFRQAFQFFKEHFSGTFRSAMICRSWIFNTQFEEMLPESNLAKLMRECYLFPCASCGEDGFYFLFGNKHYDDWSKAPHDTSVRRAMLSVLERGDRLRLGGMLYFAEDLPAFGTSHYRKIFHF